MRFFMLSLCVFALVACGGGSSGGSGQSPSSSSSPSSTNSSANSSTSSAAEQINLSGRVTYDYVPFATPTPNRLDYAATQVRPGRGLRVELLNANGQLLASSQTDGDGNYQFQVNTNQQLRVRVKAQLQAVAAPAWNFTVRDNTRNNAIYALDGSLASSGSSDSVRNLHAASGWSVSSYTSTRAAAPFAILDSIYTGVQRFIAAGFSDEFPPLNLYWSKDNLPVNGDVNLGEIGTSFYGDPQETGTSGIYILGAANDDTDEYDTHVVLHEWGHYIEDVLSRSDTLGGDHPSDTAMDMRVAWSEGFASALAAMLLDNPRYADSFGSQQGQSFRFDVSETNHLLKGWFAEASVYSILYNYYVSDSSKNPRDFADILQAIRAPEVVASHSFLSIYTLANQLKTQTPAHVPLLNQLLQGQSIFGSGIYGVGETNSGGNLDNLPVYKTLATDGTAVELCSHDDHGTYNRLGNAQFARFSVMNSGNYELRAQKTLATPGTIDPDFYLYQAGELVALGESSTSNQELLNLALTAGDYVLEVFEYDNVSGDQGWGRACFNLSVQPN